MFMLLTLIFVGTVAAVFLQLGVQVRTTETECRTHNKASIWLPTTNAEHAATGRPSWLIFSSESRSLSFHLQLRRLRIWAVLVVSRTLRSQGMDRPSHCCFRHAFDRSEPADCENRLADARHCARRQLFLCLSLLLCAGSGPACKSKDSSAPADAVMSRPVPVLLAPVARRDLPIYLDGLGTVTAFKTVTVRTQVDGRFGKVLFREGQRVSRGELLAQVDPRPFLATLHQAESALVSG